MQIWEILIIGIGLSMDALAIAICRGLKNGKFNLKDSLITGLFFGGFQALMPLIGFFVGSTFERYITAFDHWIVFGLLVLIGANMIKESFEDDGKHESENYGQSDTKKQRPELLELLLMAVATSIDALAVGITFSLTSAPIALAAPLIGITTFVISFAGVAFGSLIGSKFQKGAGICGGIALMVIGIKILLEHLLG